MPERDRSDQSAEVRMLEEEISVLRQRLHDAPRRVRLLEERLLDTRNQLAQASAQNEKLTTVLAETREQLALLRDEVENPQFEELGASCRDGEGELAEVG